MNNYIGIICFKSFLHIMDENTKFLFVDTNWLKKSACQRVDVDKKIFDNGWTLG